MVLGALLDAGLPLETLREALGSPDDELRGLSEPPEDEPG